MTEENTRNSTDSSSNTTSVGWTPDNDSLTAHSGWFVVLGVSLIILGIMAIALPTIASAMTVLFLGWILLIGGIVQGVHAFTAKQWRGFFVQALSALLYAFVGLLLLMNPLLGMFTLTIVLVAFLAVEGIFKIVMSFQVKESANWGWILFSGAVSLVLAILIWSQLPGDALWIMGLLVGINMVFSGWAMTMLALAAGEKPAKCGCDTGDEKPAV
jgi:uncharacterized membrane protein HdeD (DUF308 family)